MFTGDLVDPIRIGSAIWYQMSPLMKVILCFSGSFEHVKDFQNFTFPICRSRNTHNSILSSSKGKAFLILLLNKLEQSNSKHINT